MVVDTQQKIMPDIANKAQQGNTVSEGKEGKCSQKIRHHVVVPDQIW